jgi:hypothetical protein
MTPKREIRNWRELILNIRARWVANCSLRWENKKT